MGKFLRLLFVALALMVGATFSGIAAQGPGQAEEPRGRANGQTRSNNVYIVRLAEAPVATYTGGVDGFRATKPARGRKLNPNDPDVVRYAAYLEGRHDQTLARAGGRKLYSYKYSVNGFAAELTEAQAAALATTEGVLTVEKDAMARPATLTTPRFLGLTPGGLYEELGGVDNAGEDIVIGMLDTGIWPESESFSDRTADNPNGKTGKLGYQQIPAWNGKCTPGEQFTASNCNQKLIAAQWYNAGWGGDAATKAEFPYEFMSPRDTDGHGTHTASTAGGNAGVVAAAEGTTIGAISGIAPRARIAVYKVCWGRGDDGGCFNSDSVAAVDQALIDGVDVINFSIGGTSTNFLNAVEVAFLNAADAGVFVAASAGNDGPTASTVAHPSPWVTTVAAGTHDRTYTASATLGNGVTYNGVSLGNGLASRTLVLSSAAGLPDKKAEEVALCFPGTLNPAIVTGKVVVCDRGINARVEKSQVVRDAGGVGMILVNVTEGSVNADLHYVPTVHLGHADRNALVAYGATANPTVSLTAGTLAVVAAPDLASFSSRGPLLAGTGNLLKPDLMAPGVDILAAVAPVGHDGRSFDYLQGTSMSSPHVAGLAALLRQRRPDWSPMMIKSALMTTATRDTNVPATGGGFTQISGTPHGYGAGQVVPTRAADPGLVYDSNANDWIAFLCGTGQLTATFCPSITINPSNLNMPSIAIGAMVGTQAVTRTVKNVGGATATYNVALDGLAGFTTNVSPTSFTIAPGASRSYTVTFTRSTAPANAYGFGGITWSDGTHKVRIPVALRPVTLVAPARVASTGAAVSYPVRFGFNGPFGATPIGLVPATTQTDTVADDPTNTFAVDGPGVTKFTVTVPAGTNIARFALYDESTDGNDDLDLYVYRGATIVGASGNSNSNEEVVLVGPTAATYTVYVHGWQTDGPDAQFTLFHWLVGGATGNMAATVTPTAATIGAPGTVSLTFNGLADATRYTGAIVHTGASGMPFTLVTVDKP
jgi:subtilisin family serine protease